MTLLSLLRSQDATLSYPGVALSYLELARPLADRDAAKPWTGQPASAAAANSLSKTIHAAITVNERLLTQET